MPALTIRHDGLIASGHTVRGTGRPGSIGVHVVAGLDLVVIDGFTVRDFDVCILAESPVVIVNCEILRYRQAGIILKGSAAWVCFCSFLDDTFGGVQGAAIAASGVSPVVEANLFQISGKKRYFGLGDPRRAVWTSKQNIGVATKVFGTAVNLTDGDRVTAARVTSATLDGVTEDSPGFAQTTEGAENFRLLSSSPALRLVDKVDLPAINSRRFDANTMLPVVDRGSNRRAVEYVTAGAQEMSFSLTKGGRVRWLELIGGLSTQAFTHVASGRDGIFHRMPGTLSNPGVDITENPLDIQPSPDLAVMSYREALVGSSSAYFKPERLNLVPFTLSAAPSARSDMRGLTALTAYGWVKSRSSTADVVVHKKGHGRAQDRAVFEVAMRFQDKVAPNLSLKLGQDGTPGVDITFVAESASLASLIDVWTRNERWWFWAWAWDRGLPTIFVGSEDDPYLRAFSTRPFGLDPLTEEMTPTAMSLFLPVMDPNTERFWVGSDADKERGWHGYVDEISIDMGEAMSRGDLTSIFKSKVAFPDASRVKRTVPQMDVVFAREADIYAKPPSAFVGEISAAVGAFIEIRKVVAAGKDVYVVGRKPGTIGWGIYRIGPDDEATVIEGVPDLRDLAVDRHGDLVLVADDMPLSRIDPTEGVRYEILAPGYDFSVVAVSQDNEYVLDDARTALVLVHAASDITDPTPEVVQPLDIELTLVSVKAMAVTDSNELYVLEDGAAPRLLRILFSRSVDVVEGLGVDVALPASDTFTNGGMVRSFGDLGLLPGDAFTIVSKVEDLTTGNGEVVNDDLDPTVLDNASTRYVRSVSGTTVVLDRPLVSEIPSAGKQFEVRVVRRSATDAVVVDGAPLVAPVAMCVYPENVLAPLLIADVGASELGDPSVGVVFELRADGLGVAYHLSSLGLDLSTVRSITVRENATLAPTEVVSLLRSRLCWHMEVDPAAPRIKNSAYPGFSDLDVPDLSLNELLLSKRGAATVTINASGVAELSYRASFGSEPELDRLWLNTEYENLSELGVMTEDGVLLARQTVARMPYDPLSEVRTDWTQTVLVSV